MTDDPGEDLESTSTTPGTPLGRLLRMLENWAESSSSNPHDRVSKITLLLVAALAYESFGSDLIRYVLALV